ncbi:MAG: hypothetical protein IH584_01140 [Candidatus Aminicenantes bacterium]|nr:hypothetical protein [Candidatus Aminicenantes bacterium]
MNEQELADLSEIARQIMIIKMIGRSGKPENLYVHFKLTAADNAGAGKEILSRP